MAWIEIGAVLRLRKRHADRFALGSNGAAIAEQFAVIYALKGHRDVMANQFLNAARCGSHVGAGLQGNDGGLRERGCKLERAGCGAVEQDLDGAAITIFGRFIQFQIDAVELHIVL